MAVVLEIEKENFWICGFDIDGKDFTGHDWSGNNVLLFGSEGFGMRKHSV